MATKESNVIRIGLIDMLSAFLVSSVLLMLIIAYSKPVASKVAGYPRNFLQIEVKVINKSSLPNALELMDGAKFQFSLKTPEGEFRNLIRAGNLVRNELYNHAIVDVGRNIETNNIQLWGPSYKEDVNGVVNRDTLYYTFYGVTREKNINDWQLKVDYFDNELISKLNYEPKTDLKTIIDEPLTITANWKHLGGWSKNDQITVHLGGTEYFKVD